MSKIYQRLLAFYEVAKILGKVTGSASYEVPRGADVSLRVVVPAAWFVEGRSIEVELLRNLTCARCSGGGCNACNQSGAITLRGRTELPEFVQVFLPLQRDTDAAKHRAEVGDDGSVGDSTVENHAPKSARPVVIRIPECGGLPDANNGAIIRGWLLLEVGIADAPSSNVRQLDDQDPLSSSKMVRAETRSADHKTGEKFKAVIVTRSNRPVLPDDDNSDPPSSRVARVGSTKPPERRRVASAVDGAPSHTPKHRRSAAIYVAIVAIAAFGILALMLY